MDRYPALVMITEDNGKSCIGKLDLFMALDKKCVDNHIPNK